MCFNDGMKINAITSQNSFKGYDARPLRGFLMSYDTMGIAKEMYEIGKREGFKIFSSMELSGNYFCGSMLPKYKRDTAGLWAQDFWTIVNDKLLTLEFTKASSAIKGFLGLSYDFTQKVAKDTLTFKQINQNMWDMFEEFKDKAVLTEEEFMEKSLKFQKTQRSLMDKQQQTHISGGNVFIVRGDNGDELLIGEKELEKFSEEEIKSMYCVDKITVLPQMDFHLDLFVRPLDKKRVLLADDKLTYKILYEGFERLFKHIQTVPASERAEWKKPFVDFGSKVSSFKDIIKSNNKPMADEVAQVLEENGFEVIRVPGRIYETLEDNDDGVILKHFCNYINANVLKNRNDEIVYITNKSNIDEMLGLTPDISRAINFSFEQEFIDSILPYVKKDKIYFIKGENNFVANEMLSSYQGGIHCACSEIPFSSSDANCVKKKH